MDECSGRWAIKFCATKSAILAYRCHFPPSRLFMNDLPKLTSRCIKGLGLQYSWSFNFHEQVICAIANTNRTNGPIVKTFHTLKRKLMRYKSYCRPQLEDCPISFSNLLTVDRVLAEKYNDQSQRNVLVQHQSLVKENDASSCNLTPFSCLLLSRTSYSL